MMREKSKHGPQCGCQIEILCHKQRPQASTSGTSCLTQSLTIGELNAALGSSTETWFKDMSVGHVNRQDEALSAALWSPCPTGGIVNISATVSCSAHGMQHESPEHVGGSSTQRNSSSSFAPHFTPVRTGWWVSMGSAADMTGADTSEQDADCRNQPLSLTLDSSSVSWSSSMATPHNASFKDLPLEPERQKGLARALFSPGSCAEESEMEESNMDATVEQEEQSIPEVGVEEPSPSNQTLMSPSACSSLQKDQMSCVLNSDQAKNAESYLGSSERDAKKQLTLKQRSFDLSENRNLSNGTVCKTDQHSVVRYANDYKQIQRCTSTPKTERYEHHKSVSTSDLVEKSQTLRILTSPSSTPVKSLEPSLPHLLSSPDIFQEEENGELTDMLVGHGRATNSAESEKENGLPPNGLMEQNQTAFSGNSQNLPFRLEENRIQNNSEVFMPADRQKVRLAENARQHCLESSSAGPQSSRTRSCRKRGHPKNLFVREECQGKTAVDEVLADFFSSPESEARQRRSPPSKYKKRRLSEQQDSEESANDSRLKEESSMDTKSDCETNDGDLHKCSCKESKFATGDCADCARCTERCTGVQSDCSCGEGAEARTTSLAEASVTAAGETTSETSEKHAACVHSKAVACSDKLSESVEKSQHEHLSRDSNTPPSILRSAGKRLHTTSSVKRVRFSLDSKSAIESSSCCDLREEKFLNKRKSNLKGKDLLLMKKTGPYRNTADVGRTFGVDETGTSTCVASCGVSPVSLTSSGLGKTQHAPSAMFDDVSAKEAEDEFSQLTFSCLEEMCSAASSYENSTDQADTDLEKSTLVLTQCSLSKADEEKDADQNKEADILTTKLADEMMAGRNLTGKVGTDSQGKYSSSANICVPAEGEGAKLFSAASKPCSEKGSRSLMPNAETKEKTENTASTGEDAPSRIVSDQPKVRLSSKKTKKFMYPTSSQIENTCPEKIYNFSTFNFPSSMTAESPLSKTVDTIVCKFGARTSSCLLVGGKIETGTEMMYGKMEKSADGKVFENSDGMPASDNLVTQGSDLADEMQPDWSVFEEETDWSKYDVCLMDNAEQKLKNVTNSETTQGLKLVPCADSETSEGLQSAMDKHFETHHLPAAIPVRSCLLQVGVDITTCTVLKNDHMTDADDAHDMHDRLDNSPMPDAGFIHDVPTLEREKTERLEERNASLSCAAKCFSGRESEVNGAKGEVSEERTDCTEMAEGHPSAVTRCERKRKEPTGESSTSGQVTEMPANDRVLGATSEASCHAKPADSTDKFSYCRSVASDGSERLAVVEAETMWNIETASLSVYDPKGFLGYSSTSGKERVLRDESLHTAESLFQGGRGDSNLCQHSDLENQKPGQRTVTEEMGIDLTSAANIDSNSLTSAADFDDINLTSSANSYKINPTSAAHSSSGNSVNVATATGLVTAKESGCAFLPGTLCGEMELTAVDTDIVCRSPEGGGETERVKEESKLMMLNVATRVLQETSLPIVCAHPLTCAPEQSAPGLLSTEVDEANNSQKNQVDDADVDRGLDSGSFTSVKKSILDQEMTSRCQRKLYTNAESLALPCQSTSIHFSATGFSTAGGKFVTLSAKAKERAVALWKSVEKEMYAQEAAVTHGGDGDLSLARQNVTEEEVLSCGKKEEGTVKKGRETSAVISAASLSPCLEPASAVDSRATLPKGFRPFRPPRVIRKPGEEHEKQDEKLEKSKLVSSFVRRSGREDGRCEQIQHSLKVGDCAGRGQTADLSDPLLSSPSSPENRNAVRSSRRTSDEFSDEGEGWGSVDLGVLLASHELHDGVKQDVLNRDKVVKNSETLAKENYAGPRPSSSGNVKRMCCEHPGDKDDRKANVVAHDVEMLKLSRDVSSVIDASYLKQVADQHRFIASESATKRCLPQEVSNNINGSGFSEILSTKHPGSEDHMDLMTANLCDGKCSAEGLVTHLTSLSFTNSSDRKEGCGRGAQPSQFKIDHSHKIGFSICSRGPRGEIKTEPSYCEEGKNCKEDRYDEFSDEGLLYVFADESFDSVRREDCSLAVEGEPHEKDENESESRRNAGEGHPLQTSTVKDTQVVEKDVMVDLDSAVAKELMDDILSRRETFSPHSVTEGNESVRDGNDSVTDGFLTNMEVGLDVSLVQQDTGNISMAEDSSLASQMEVMGGVLFVEGAPTTEDTGAALPCLEEAFGKSRELCPSTGKTRSIVQINNTFGTEFEKHVSSPGSKLNSRYEKQKQTKDNSESFPIDSLVNDNWIDLAKVSDSLPPRDRRRPKECSDPEKSSHISVNVETVESKESLPQVTSAGLEPGEGPTGQNDAEGKSDFKNNACTILQGKKHARTSESVLVTEVTEQCEEVAWLEQNVFTAPFEVTDKCSISLLVDRNRRITATAGSGTAAVAHTQWWPDTSCPDKHHVREDASESELKRDLPAEDMLSVKRDTPDYCREEKDVEVQTFVGFQTGRGKPVKVSMESMDAAKAFLQDVGVIERETSSNKTSHTKVVTCSGNMSVECEDLRSDGDKILTALKPQNGKANTVTGVEEKKFGAFVGFSTASGYQVTVSEKSLCHGRKLLASIEDSTAKAYGIGAVEALTDFTWDFGDKSACCDKELVSATRTGDGVRATETTADVIDNLGEKSSYLDTKLSASVQDATTKGYGIRAVEAIIDVPDDFGFHTPRTKICKVGTSATNIRRDLDADTSRAADVCTKSLSYTGDSFHSRLPHTCCQGFTTAGGRVVSVPKESLLRARAMLSDVEHPADVTRSPIAEGMEVWKQVNAEKHPHVGRERKSSALQMAEMSVFTASGDCRVDPKTSGDGRVDPKASGDGRVDPKTSGDGRVNPKTSGDGRVDPKTSGDGRVDPKTSGDGRVDPKVQTPVKKEVLALSETVCHSDLGSEKGVSQQGGRRELTAGCVDTDTPNNKVTFHLMQPQKVGGFQTARGKLVAPSRDAVKLALKLLSSTLKDSWEKSENEQHTVDRSGFFPGTEDVSKQEMDILEGESAAETGGKCVAGERASCPDGSTETGFQTGRDKQVTVSPVPHLQVQQVLQPDDPPGHEVSKDIRGSLNLSSFTGFQTGGGSKVTVSEKALVHARKVMQSLDEIECDVQDSQAERKEIPAVLVPSRVEFGFQTAKGSSVGVSRKSLERAQQLLKMDEQIVVSNHKQKFDLHIMGSSDTSGEMSDIPKHDQEVRSFLKEDMTDEITRCWDHGAQTKEQVVEVIACHGTQTKEQVVEVIACHGTQTKEQVVEVITCHGTQTKEQVVEVIACHDSLFQSEDTENETPQTSSSMAVEKNPQILQHGGVPKRASTPTGSCQPLETGKSSKTLLCDVGKGTVDALPVIKRTACLKQKSPGFQPPLKKGKFVPPSCSMREKQAADYYLENHAHSKDTFVKNVSNDIPALHNDDIMCRNIQLELESPNSSPTQSAVSDCLAREEATMQQAKIIRQKKHLKVRPAKGKWLTLKQTQKQMKLRDLDIRPRLLTNHELVKAGVSPTVLGVNSCTAEEYRFFLPAFYPRGCSGILVGDGALLVGDAFGFAGKEEFYRGFLTMDGVDPALTSQPWVYNHYRWLVWKLAAYEVALPQAFASRALTPDMLMTQLKYRYDREVDACQRSALKKIVERDDTASRRLALCVSNITRGEASDAVTVEVTDGWYCIWAKPDLHLQQLIDRRKIQIGQKIITTGAELVGSHDACGPLEIPTGLHLKLWGNSTRPAPFWAKLGYQPCPAPLCVPLSSVVADGGLIGCVDVVVVRKYPVMFMEKRRDANCVFRTAEMEDRASHCYEQQKELIMDRLCSKLQAEMEREDSVPKARQKRQSLGLQEIQALTSGTELCEALDIESYPEEMQAILTDRQREQLWEQQRRQQEQKQEQFRLRLEQAWHESLSQQRGERVVTPVQKLLVAGCCRRDVDAKTSLLLTVWRPGEDWEAVTEGKRYRMFSLTSSSRSRQSRHCVQLTAGRHTRLQSLAIDENLLDLVYEPREVWSVSDLQRRKPLYDEIDFTGRVHDIISTNRQGYDSMCAMDVNRELISVLFWGGLQTFGLQNFFTKGTMFTGFNLRVRNSAQGQFELVAFQETSYFTASSRLPELCSDRLRQLAPGAQHESGKSADWQTVSNTSLDDSRSSVDQSSKSLHQSTESPEGKRKRSLQQQKLFRLQSYGKPPTLSPLPNCVSPAAGKAFKKVKTNSKDSL